jgi:hypothetical protein
MSSEPTYARPTANPFQPSEKYSDVAPTLVYAALESMAYVHDPTVDANGIHPLVVGFSMLWAHRISNGGEESFSCAAAWELSVRVAQMEADGVPLPNFDITTRCDDVECDIDHATQYRVMNDFLQCSRDRDHAGAVEAYTRHVRRWPLDHAERMFVEYLSMLVVHVAMRVSEYRNGLAEEMPQL